MAGFIRKRPASRNHPNGAWKAAYRDRDGNEKSQTFSTKRDAQRWLDSITADLVKGTYVDPQDARITMREWANRWLDGYRSKRTSTVRQAEVHLRRIVAKFGTRRLDSITPSDVKNWMVELQNEGLSTSTIYALHSRLGQLYADAVLDKLVASSPVSRRTSPATPKQRPYVATTEQVWALHDAMPEHFRPVILLGAFAGLRLGEIAAIRVTDVDFMRGIIHPAIQYPAEELKTESSKWPIPIPQDLALELSRVPTKWGSRTLVVGAFGRPVSPYTIEAAFRLAREAVPGLPEGFRLHDLRHYYASLLIASGLDVKTVQRRLRHASAKVTLDTYGHYWPDKDEAAVLAVSAAFANRSESPAASLRPGPLSVVKNTRSEAG
jgi:integrase